MALFRRPVHLPPDVRAEIGLGPKEHPLAVAELTDGWAAATMTHLHAVVGGGVIVRPWASVDGARLDTEGATLTLTWVDGTPATALPLADDGAIGFPRVVHDRVQSSVVHSEKVVLAGGATVRIALRRGVDGTLLTQVIGTGDVDLGDPATAAAVEAAEARVRDAAGL